MEKRKLHSIAFSKKKKVKQLKIIYTKNYPLMRSIMKGMGLDYLDEEK